MGTHRLAALRENAQENTAITRKHDNLFIFIVLQLIDQFRYIKIQPYTIDLSTRPWGINPSNSSYFPEPRAEVYCFRLNFNISKLVYYQSQGIVYNIYQYNKVQKPQYFGLFGSWEKEKKKLCKISK